jgi:hypothetical protein
MFLTMASHLNPPNRQPHVYNFRQSICDIRHVGLTRLLGYSVWRLKFINFLLCQCLPCGTSSPTNGGPLAPSGSLAKGAFQWTWKLSFHPWCRGLFGPLSPMYFAIGILCEWVNSFMKIGKKNYLCFNRNWKHPMVTEVKVLGMDVEFQ